MGLQGCDGGASFLCLIIQKHDLCGRIENNVEAFRYTVLIHISRMTSATSARASRIKSPGADEVDLKRAAKVSGNKSCEMIPVKELLPLTGYIRGGCSPIGMKKQFVTVLDESCLPLDTIVFSAGKIGMQIEMDPKALIDFIGAKTAAITAG